MEDIMNTTMTSTKPHANYLDMLFAHKSTIGRVFKDVLGLYGINHVAISHINAKQELQTLSSTPSLEFNLFSSSLWQFDKTYQPTWYNQCAASSWQALYTPAHYDELYQMKQTKHHYPLGISLAAKLNTDYFIYSLASMNDCERTRWDFTTHHHDFYKIGEYCSNALLPLFST